MQKTAQSTLVQLPGLEPDYDYCKGEVVVYGRKGKKGDFTPDPKFTPQLIEAIKKELIEGWRTGQRTSGWEAIVKLAFDAGIYLGRAMSPKITKKTQQEYLQRAVFSNC